MTVFCRDCDLVHSNTRDPLKPWEWRCMAVPTEPGYRYVDPDYSPSPPYARCGDVNRDGQCQFFEPLRNGPKETSDAA